MSFFLGFDHVNRNSVEISELQFSEFEEARNTIVSLVEIEALFSIIARSYISFEKLLCEISVEYMCCEWDIDNFNDYNERLNVSVMTILSAVNAYHDQRKSILRRSSALSKTQADIEKEFAWAYDDSFEYRLMEMMINYSKHNRLPVESISIGGKSEWEGGKPKTGENSRQSVSVCPFLSSDKIIENRRKLKTKTVDELSEKHCRYIDLKSFLRSYISDLAKCHNHLRNGTSTAFSSAEKRLEAAQTIYLQEFSDEAQRAELLHIWCSDDRDQKKYLCFQSLPQLRKKRNEELKALTHVSRKFVSTASKQRSSTIYSDNSLFIER